MFSVKIDSLKNIKPAIIIEISVHAMFWLAITITPILLRPFPPSLQKNLPPWNFVLINGLLALHFYLNVFFLIPFFLTLKKSPALYFGALVLSLAGMTLLMNMLRPNMPAPPVLAGRHPPSFAAVFSLFPLLALTGAGFAYRYLADRSRLISNQREIANAALLSELAFLRSQISPHFIFNVINSVVALSRFKPAKVEPTLIRLSQLMRFMLYVNDNEMITLRQKDEYLRSYVGLQELRFQGTVAITLDIRIANADKTIEPMLLIPFVENAFKHGTADVTNPEIHIALQSDERILSLNVQNKYNAARVAEPGDHGIGLNNVRRRLDLLYPAKHKLLIQNTGHFFEINLEIELK